MARNPYLQTQTNPHSNKWAVFCVQKHSEEKIPYSKQKESLAWGRNKVYRQKDLYNYKFVRTNPKLGEGLSFRAIYLTCTKSRVSSQLYTRLEPGGGPARKLIKQYVQTENKIKN